MRCILNYILILLFTVLFFVGQAQVTVDDSFVREYVAPHAEVNTATVTVDSLDSSLNFSPNNSFSFQFGKPKESRWIKLQVQNISKLPRNLLFEITYPNLYHGRLYVKDLDSVKLIYDFGIKYPYSERPYKHTNIILPITIDSNTLNTYWMEMLPAEYANNFNLILWDESEREAYKITELIFFTIYQFIHFIFLVILGIVLYITRQRWQWSLFVYVLLGAIYKYVDFGVGFKYIWSDYPRIQQIAPIVLVNIHSIAAIFFMRRYFDTKEKVKILDKAFLIMANVCVLIIAIRLLTLFVDLPFLRFIQSLNALLILMISFAPFATIIYFRYKRTFLAESIWFLACFTPPIIVFTLFALRQIGFFVVNTITLSNLPIFLVTIDVDNLFVWAIMWEVLCVSLLLIFRLDKLFKDNLNMYKKIEKQQKDSVRQLMSSIEGERRRVAQELHDGSGVSLSAIRMRMTHLLDELPDARSKEKLGSLMVDMDQVSRDIREISHFIMPISLSKLGLKAGVKELIGKLRKSYPQIEFTLFQQYEEGKLSETQQINIYRICQELLNNTIKHADAKQVSLSLIEDEQTMRISMEDDGVGFDTQKTSEGMGMNSIQLRTELMQGQFEMESRMMSGSFFHIVIPIS